MGATAGAVAAPLAVAPLAPPVQNVVAPLAFGAAAFGAYIVVQIGTGRARRTGSNWLVTGLGALLNVALNLALIPSFGRVGHRGGEVEPPVAVEAEPGGVRGEGGARREGAVSRGHVV